MAFRFLFFPVHVSFPVSVPLTKKPTVNRKQPRPRTGLCAGDSVTGQITAGGKHSPQRARCSFLSAFRNQFTGDLFFFFSETFALSAHEDGNISPQIRSWRCAASAAHTHINNLRVTEVLNPSHGPVLGAFRAVLRNQFSARPNCCLGTSFPGWFPGCSSPHPGIQR